MTQTRFVALLVDGDTLIFFNYTKLATLCTLIG